MAKIREIFSSIQGEGPLVGYKQLFLRFCKCNLNCSYCDTDFDISKAKDYTVKEIIDICSNNEDCHSVSLTGGEPLLEFQFIKEFAKKCHLPLYLETNGTLVNELEQLIDCVTYVAADIKLPSCTEQSIDWENQDRFFTIASQKKLFAKIVFNSAITEEEIQRTSSLCKKYNIELILQPMMAGNALSVSNKFLLEVLNRYLVFYKKVRLIPQVHKFIQVD